MTVKQLISKLKECNPKSEVCLILDLDYIKTKTEGITAPQVSIVEIEENDDWCELILDV